MAQRVPGCADLQQCQHQHVRTVLDGEAEKLFDLLVLAHLRQSQQTLHQVQALPVGRHRTVGEIYIASTLYQGKLICTTSCRYRPCGYLPVVILRWSFEDVDDDGMTGVISKAEHLRTHQGLLDEGELETTSTKRLKGI